MPHFAVYALDKPGMLVQREALRPGHRERLRRHEHPLKVVIGGPLLDGKGAMVGTLLVIEAASQAVVENFLAGDPYVAAGVFQSCEVRPFRWGLGLPGESDG